LTHRPYLTQTREGNTSQYFYEHWKSTTVGTSILLRVQIACSYIVFWQTSLYIYNSKMRIYYNRPRKWDRFSAVSNEFIVIYTRFGCVDLTTTNPSTKILLFAFSSPLSPCRPRPFFPDDLDDMTRSLYTLATHARVYKTDFT